MSLSRPSTPSGSTGPENTSQLLTPSFQAPSSSGNMDNIDDRPGQAWDEQEDNGNDEDEEEEDDDDEPEREDRQLDEDHYTDSPDDPMEDIQYPPQSQQSSDESEFPRSSIPSLQLSQDLIEAIQSATLEEDLDDKLLHQIQHPSNHVEDIDRLSELSMRMFTALNNSSQQTYADIKEALLQFNPSIEMDSYFIAKRKLEQLTGVFKIMTDMCVDGCIAFTGPFLDLDACPECKEARYHPQSNPRKPRKARKQFSTIPLGPQLQAQWKSHSGAKRMRYRNFKTRSIFEMMDSDGTLEIKEYDDIFHGSDYLEAVARGEIQDDDVLVEFSLDGAQLYRDKESDCWFFIWIILDISPDLRYQKRYVLPGGFIPGPKSPKNKETFLLPGFRHVSALQKQGLKCWDGFHSKWIRSRPFFSQELPTPEGCRPSVGSLDIQVSMAAVCTVVSLDDTSLAHQCTTRPHSGHQTLALMNTITLTLT